MLSTIRNNKKSLMGLVLAGFMATIMMSFGLNARGCNKRSQEQVVIRVNKHEIMSDEYERELTRVTDLYRNQLGANFAAMKNFLNVEQRTIDGLIEERIADDFVNTLGLSASTAQLEAYIAQLPFFQKFGLTQETYDSFLHAQGMTGESLEEKTRMELAEVQFHSMLADLNRPTDQELKAAYREQNTKAEFEYIALRPADFEKKVDTTDEAKLKQFYDGYSDKYKKPRSVRYTYLKFDPAKFLDKVELNEEDLQALYIQKQNQFAEPREFKLRQIVFNKSAEPSSELEKLVTGKDAPKAAPADEAKKAKAKDVVDRLKAGEDFATIAKQVSEDEKTKANGGDRGWILSTALDKDIRTVVDKMDIGKFSNVIETPDKLTIVFLEDVKERRIKPFEQVRPQLENDLRMQDAPEYTRVEAENFLRKWNDDPQNKSVPLAEFAKKENMTAKSTEKLLSAKEDPADAPGLSSQVVAFAQGSREAVRAGIFDYIVEITETKDSYYPPLEEIKAEVVRDYVATESKILARKEAEAARNALAGANGAEKKTLAELAKSYGTEVKTTAAVTRSDTGKEPLLTNPMNKQTLFALSAASPVAPEILSSDAGDLVIAQLKSKTPPDDKEFAAKLDSVRNQEMQAAQSRMSSFVSQSLRAEADVWVSPKLLENKSLPSADVDI